MSFARLSYRKPVPQKPSGPMKVRTEYNRAQNWQAIQKGLDEFVEEQEESTNVEKKNK